MKVYLAGRYLRREELNRYRAELRALDIDVTSHWLDGPGQRQIGTGEVLGHEKEALVEGGMDTKAGQAIAALCAQQDLEDVRAADVVVSFTEAPGSDVRGRGGRHVEFGMAVALGKPLVIVGYREHVFHCVPSVTLFEYWPDARDYLAACDLEEVPA